MIKMHKQVKVGLSEKQTKFKKIFLMDLTNQLIYLVNVQITRKFFFFKLCVLLKKSDFCEEVKGEITKKVEKLR